MSRSVMMLMLVVYLL